MGSPDPLSYRATLAEYQQRADALLRDQAGALEIVGAQAAVAREHGFDNWAALAEFADSINRDSPVSRFEAAVEAVVAGDVAALRSMLHTDRGLVSMRSTRSHHATLLHYVAANGVENWRQKTPASAVEVAKTLLDAGAEVDAVADMYRAKCTTMSMLVSSCHPAKAGLQISLAETLLNYGSALDGMGPPTQAPLMTALAFGYRDTAEALARRGASANNLGAAAGLGRPGDAARLLPGADGPSRHAALALAAQHGHVEIVRLLLDAGEDPSRYNPAGHHGHSTPMHQAALAGHAAVVRLLVERGARLDVRDTVFKGTPLAWAVHGGRTEVADYLRARLR